VEAFKGEIKIKEIYFIIDDKEGWIDYSEIYYN
jgi:hypothetical protein